MWWHDKKANTGLKHQIKQLIARGQLQFVGCTWTKIDYGSTEVTSAIEAIEVGKRFLMQTFGLHHSDLHVAWDDDSLGLSSNTPDLLALMGYDSLFTTRVSQQQSMVDNGELQFIWESQTKELSDIFVQVS